MSTQRPGSSNNAGGGGGSSVPAAIKLTDYLRPVFQEAFMVREYCQFSALQTEKSGSDDDQLQQSRAIPGMYVIPSATSVYLWFGALFVTTPSSPWHGAVLRFLVSFPENYPNNVPKLTLFPTSRSADSSTFTTLQTHPDVVPATGQFNLRAYYNASSSSSSSSRTYKVLKAFRKAFTRHFTDVDVSSSVNTAAAQLASSDHAEFMAKCATEAEESANHVDAVDSFLLQKFRNDANLILLGGSAAQRDNRNGVVPPQELERGAARSSRALGLSFL